MSKDYNNTLNLPKTDFPMRAGLPKREPDMLRHWEEMDLYNEQLKKNEGKPLFSLHDGPPFSNGAIHMGHALNKALKDFINRSYMMRGRYVPYSPPSSRSRSSTTKRCPRRTSAAPAMTMRINTSTSRWTVSSVWVSSATGSTPISP